MLSADAEIEALHLNLGAHLLSGRDLSDHALGIRVEIFGRDLWAIGGGCTRTDPHMPASLSQNSASAQSGRYDLSIAVNRARSMVNSKCHIDRFLWNQIDGIRIDASIPTDSALCAAYCSGSDPGSGCEQDCSAPDRALTASRTMTKAEIESSGALTNGVAEIRIGAELEFRTLSPLLSSDLSPDLATDAPGIRLSAHVTEETFKPGDCALVEKCVNGPGKRTLLRFDGSFQNIGRADLFLGAPEGNPLFEYSACHGHYHLHNMMLFELLDPVTHAAVMVGDQSVVSHKQGFCVIDSGPVSTLPSAGRYDCSYQGLSAGWEDSYDSSLDCQWIDVTGVPPGEYLLRITVNPEGIFPEANTANNSSETTIKIP